MAGRPSKKTAQKQRIGNPDKVIPFQWKAGQSGNVNGRPKKFFTTMKDLGYKNSEITDCISNMLGYTHSMLEDVYKNDQATALERGVARCIYSFIKTGQLGGLDVLLHRAYGAPKQLIDHTSKGKPLMPQIVVMTEVDKKRLENT